MVIYQKIKEEDGIYFIFDEDYTIQNHYYGEHDFK